MEEMEQVETKIMNSFRLAKTDIIKLQERFMELKTSHARIIERIARLENEKAIQPITIIRKEKPLPQIIYSKTARKTYVASKEGKKFHTNNCPYAQNIKPKTKIIFKTKTKALNLGYKPCSCIK